MANISDQITLKIFYLTPILQMIKVRHVILSGLRHPSKNTVWQANYLLK